MKMTLNREPNRRRYRRRRRCHPSLLRFSPYAWAKLIYLRDRGPTEVGGFGISAANDLLFVQDLALVRQSCSLISVQFHDTAVADYFDVQVDRGLLPEQFARIWLHTHPGNSAEPSGTDEATFARCFGGADWAVMAILASGGQTYARLRFRAGPGGEMEIPVALDFSRPFAAADHPGWDEEFRTCVCPEPAFRSSGDRADVEPLLTDLGSFNELADFIGDTPCLTPTVSAARKNSCPGGSRNYRSP